MGCGCGGNKRITNVTRNTSAKLPKQSIQSSNNNNAVNTANTIQSLAVKKDLSSDERAREKKRREIMLRKLGRI